jgi:hypothetical protein
MCGVTPTTSYEYLFNWSEFLNLQCKYTFPSTNFIYIAKELFKQTHIYIVNTRNKIQLHKPNANFSHF